MSEHFSLHLYPKIIYSVMERDFAVIDNNFKTSTDLSACFLLPKFETKLSKIYEEKRDWLRQNYFPKNKVVDESITLNENSNSSHNDKALLDMHKIAAVVARCLLLHKPISFDIDKADKFIKKNLKGNDTTWLINNYLINYKIAVDVALKISMYDLFDKLGTVEEKGDGKLKDINYTLKQISRINNDFYLPNTTLLPITHEPFYNSLVINLAINDVNKRDFDYLGFATMCFQLQQYIVLKIEFDQLSAT